MSDKKEEPDSTREARLLELHDAITAKLLEILESGEATAAHITAAINHLRANGIEAASGDQQAPLRSLAGSLPFAPDGQRPQPDREVG